MSADLYQIHAIEKAKLPTTWRAFKWECFPKSGDCIYVAVTGAVCEHQYIKGRRKGKTNWSKRDARTEVTVNIPIAEHEAWKREWEKVTSKCSECTGTGDVIKEWSVKEGVTYGPCPKCNGSGTP